MAQGDRDRSGEPAVNHSVGRSFRLWSPGRHGTRVEADILRLSSVVPRLTPSIHAAGSASNCRNHKRFSEGLPVPIEPALAASEGRMPKGALGMDE
jgi:hypothetical protein